MTLEDRGQSRRLLARTTFPTLLSSARREEPTIELEQGIDVVAVGKRELRVIGVLPQRKLISPLAELVQLGQNINLRRMVGPTLRIRTLHRQTDPTTMAFPAATQLLG